MRLPVVLFNGRIRNEWVTSINSDNVGGGREIAALFLKRGARRVGYIAGKKGNMANEDRLAGFYGRLAEEGVSNIRIEPGNFSYEGGYKAAMTLLSAKSRPDAIFCASDLMAIGALEAARSELGLRVPEDVMIAGFNDIPAAAWPSIGLTTIRQDGPRMVAEALATLDHLISGRRQDGGLLRIVPAPLIERRSTLRGPKPDTD